MEQCNFPQKPQNLVSGFGFNYQKLLRVLVSIIKNYCGFWFQLSKIIAVFEENSIAPLGAQTGAAFFT